MDNTKSLDVSKAPVWNYTLCGRNGSCCPVVEQVDDDTYRVTDDHGGSVLLTNEQVCLMQTVIDHARTRV